jgi:hypothetical protein
MHFILLIILSSAFVLYFFNPIFWAPNSFLFTEYGDGFTQYFNILYYIQHNPGYIDFIGSNYPYSEHYIYTDGQSFFAAVLKTLYPIFPSIGHYSIGIFNSLCLFSVWVTPFLLFGILRRLQVRPWVAVLGSMGITFMQPQVFRMLSHFSLSYSCAIPLSLYLCLRLADSKSPFKCLLLLFFSQLVWLFTHPYLGLMCCLVVGVSWAVYAMFNAKEVWNNKRILGIPLMAFIMPIVLFQAFMALTDKHTEKSENVYGVFTYCGEPDDVLLPHHPPLKPILDHYIGGKYEQTWEGWAYIGMTTTATLFLAAFVFGIALMTKKITWRSIQRQYLLHAFIAALPLLALSWAFPFKFFPELLEHFPIVTQFRSLGRFAWPFFYISTLTSVYLLNAFYVYTQKRGRRLLGILVVLVGTFLYMLEGFYAQKEVGASIVACPNYFREDLQPSIFKSSLDKIEVDKYQAILPIPYFYQGSGNFFKRPQGGSMHMAMLSSVYTGLPTLSGLCSRGDVWESRNLLQLLSAPYYTKKIKSDLPSDKPILLVRSNYDEYISPAEQAILNKATLLAQNDLGYGFYEIELSQLFKDETVEVMRQFDLKKERLYQKNNWYVDDSTCYLIEDGFDALPAVITLDGLGALTIPKQGSNEIKVFETAPENQWKAVDYHLRMWVYNGKMDAMNYVFFVTKGFDGEALHDLNVSRPDEATTIMDDWSLIEFDITVPAGQFQSIQISSYSALRSKSNLIVDEFLVYTNRSNVYKVLETQGNTTKRLVFNGHRLKKR